MSLFSASSLLHRCHVPADLSAITLRSALEQPAEAGDMTAVAVERIWQKVEALYRTGMNPGIALCLRRRGEVILDRTIGHARGNGPQDDIHTYKTVLTPETPVCLFSASKAITAIVMHHLAERRLIDLLHPIAYYIPEFGQNGKENTTILHLLTHRGGIPTLGADIDPDTVFDQDAVMQLLYNAESLSRPGRITAYHAITGGFIFGEIVRRVTGKNIHEYLQEHFCAPMGMRFFNYGVSDEHVNSVPLHYLTGIKPVFPFNSYVRNLLGADLETCINMSNDPRYMQGIVPAGNIYATAEETSRFFQMLLNHGHWNGKQILDPLTVQHAVMEHDKPEIDRALLLPMRYSAGMMLGSHPFGLFGPSTEQAFGHLGFVNIFCWADPERDISCTMLTTGKPLIGPHMKALFSLLACIARECPSGPGKKWMHFTRPMQQMVAA